MAAGNKKYDRQRNSNSNKRYIAELRHDKNKRIAIEKHGERKDADHKKELTIPRGSARAFKRSKGIKVQGVVNTCLTSIRDALVNAKVSASVTETKIARTCVRVLQGKSGIINLGKGWNASLSFKTANKLKEEGILV